jgi:uncharacterized protein (TIGR02466 family)|tara:strand:- start:864 stop:1478 length:615 start_codon:yes stop_codon:yes gene_type:complete
MIEALISVIFPIPVYKAKLERGFTTQELRFVEKMKTKCVPNAANMTSTNNYVLNNSSFATLKKEIDLFIEDYFSKILFPPKTISPYITQSWLNYTEPKGSHPKHRHLNSYLSGVLYINADKAHDTITFEHDRYDQINLPTTEWNSFNSNSWSFPVESGDIVIFPSRLPHLVTKKKGKNTRVSLSFNVFVKGNLGKARDLTELRI